VKLSRQKGAVQVWLFAGLDWTGLDYLGSSRALTRAFKCLFASLPELNNNSNEGQTGDRSPIPPLSTLI